MQDLAAHFYLSEDDVGKNRAEACRDRLQELNIAVAVSASSDDLSEEFLSQFQVCSPLLPPVSMTVFGRPSCEFVNCQFS